MSKRKFSIITITFNSERYLRRTIESVLYQPDVYFEYIIIDGGSHDNTVEIIKEYSKKDHRISWISESDLGISDAMNKGIKLASGEIIGILHSDDWYCENTLNIVDEWYKVNRENVILCGDINFYDGRNFKRYNSVPEHLLSKMSVWHPAIFVPKVLYKTMGGYSIKKRIAMDYDLLLRAKVLNNAEFIHVPIVLTNVSKGGISDTSLKNKIKGLLEVYKSQQFYKVAGLKHILFLINRIFVLIFGYMVFNILSSIQWLIGKDLKQQMKRGILNKHQV